jgi:hypothetical protein
VPLNQSEAQVEAELEEEEKSDITKSEPSDDFEHH